MVPRPVALGLFLCDQAIVEEATRKTSLVGMFNHLTAKQFPFLPPPFTVFAALTDGQGTGRIALVVSRLETGEGIHAFRTTANFPDRLAISRMRFRIRECRFPQPGMYEFTLLIDDEWVAHNRLQILATGDPS